MIFRSPYNSLPELRELNGSERLRVWQIAIGRTPRLVRIVSNLVVAVVAGLTIWVSITLAEANLLFVMLAAGAGGFLGAVASEQFLFYFARPHVRAVLGTHCARCGYDLRATPNRCPECGTVPTEAKP